VFVAKVRRTWSGSGSKVKKNIAFFRVQKSEKHRFLPGAKVKKTWSGMDSKVKKASVSSWFKSQKNMGWVWFKGQKNILLFRDPCKKNMVCFGATVNRQN
jgi:hypothetical protein